MSSNEETRSENTAFSSSKRNGKRVNCGYSCYSCNEECDLYKKLKAAEEKAASDSST